MDQDTPGCYFQNLPIEMDEQQIMARLGPKPQSSYPWKAHGFDAPKVLIKAELQNISKPRAGVTVLFFQENLDRKPWLLRISQSKLSPVNCPIISHHPILGFKVAITVLWIEFDTLRMLCV